MRNGVNMEVRLSAPATALNAVDYHVGGEAVPYHLTDAYRDTQQRISDTYFSPVVTPGRLRRALAELEIDILDQASVDAYKVQMVRHYDTRATRR